MRVCGLVANSWSLSHKNGLEHIWPTQTGQPEEGALLMGEKACQAFVSGQGVKQLKVCVRVRVFLCLGSLFLSASQGSV